MLRSLLGQQASSPESGDNFTQLFFGLIIKIKKILVFLIILFLLYSSHFLDNQQVHSLGILRIESILYTYNADME